MYDYLGTNSTVSSQIVIRSVHRLRTRYKARDKTRRYFFCFQLLTFLYNKFLFLQIAHTLGDPSLTRQSDGPFDLEAEQKQFAPLPKKRITRKRKEITNTELCQKFGVLAVGESVCREFGGDGIFYGTINAFRREGDTELYTVRYTDGDQEDFDLEEYNFAYALRLQHTRRLECRRGRCMGQKNSRMSQDLNRRMIIVMKFLL
jgi:hypothetical protein